MFKKLKDNTGASLMIALSFLLICVMICTVILTAASGNVNRINHRADQQQAQYTLSSAAQLLADGLDNIVFTRVSYSPASRLGACEDTHDSSETEGYDINLVAGIISATAGENTENKVETALKEDILAAARCIYNGTSFSKTFTIESDNLDDVTVTMSMDSRYNLTYILSLENAGRIELRYGGVKDDQTITVNKEHSYERKDGETSITETCTTSFNKTTTTVTWSKNPIITEKEAVTP